MLGDPKTSQEAEAELVEIGSAAVLALAAALRAQQLDPPTPVLRTLGNLKSQAVSAVPELLVALRKGPDRTTALWALGQVGPYAENRIQLGQDILEALGSSVDFFLHELGRSLSRLGVDPHGSLAELEQELNKGNPFTWQFVAEILGESRTDGDAVPVLLMILETERLPTSVPVSAAFPANAPFQVREYSARMDDQIRIAAANALVRIAPEDPDTIPAYLVLLDTRRPDLRREAVMALGRQGEAAAEAIPQLLQMTRDADSRIAGEAITALGMMGRVAKDAIPALEKLAEHTDVQIAQRARVALRQIRR